jgi:cell division cycle 14
MFDECKLSVFEPISRENGPSILPQISSFLGILREKLTRINKQIHVCCSLGSESRVNCIFLICLFLLLEKDLVGLIVEQQANKVYPSKYAKPKPRPRPDFEHPLTIFQGIYPSIEDYDDATASPYTLQLSDVLGGVMKAVSLGWFDWQTFDTALYNFYLAPENGFMTWVVPGRLLVLSAPGIADSPLIFDMLPLFRKWRIGVVVSFAAEARGFEDLSRVGIERLTLDCASDNLPPVSEVMKFMELCDSGRTIAICSLNGLGRGPMFSAIWLVHSFGFSPKEAIGWVRTVRQAAIYGVQQDFIVRMDRAFHPQVTETNLVDHTLERLQLRRRRRMVANKVHRPLKLTYGQ